MIRFAALCFALTGLFATCAGAERAPDPKELVGEEFLLEDLAGAGVMDIVQSTLQFQSEDQVAGNGGCNRYFGSVELQGESIKLGPLGATQRMCPEAVMNQEQRFLAALGSAVRIVIDGPYLLIYSEGDEKPLKFTRLVKDPGEREAKKK